MIANRTSDYPGFVNSSHLRHKPLKREIKELAPGVWAFIGYSSSNFGVIKTEHGYIMVDTGDDLPGAHEAAQEIAKLAHGPLQGIIFTHSHPDHRGAAEVFLAGTKNIPVWAHPQFGSEASHGSGLEKILGQRFGKQFGLGISEAEYTENFVVPHVKSGKLLAPNKKVNEGITKLAIDGIELEIHTMPSETDDHLAIYLPQKKIIFSGDAVYGMFPNISPLRGGKYRDVERWAKSIRKLMQFDADAIICGHLIAPVGEEARRIFSDTAEALEYVYKTTIAGMNAGKSADELAANIALPEHLANAPWLGEYYGAVIFGVRAIFAEKMGWFDGNPTHIAPLSPQEEAGRMIALAGGEQAMLDKAMAALEQGDYRWAMKLSDYLLAGACQKQAKVIKADAMDALAREITPISARNYLQSSAWALRGEIGE